ncbi:phosphate ABC transporter permease PstA [Phormidium sp. CLA17]|uniref:phosphate ABC transporter permease PstA n=1 Tax=Leptolyngbya sp. Cla-17 TaxID=2803751 RepID=UPI00149118D4|nr:phosphate ABC transporter permease PstA [Leptolyngbya sp. Cla-17]MBM0741832.1 phosphate ABC transporter permease PstA [Leptolyngbya sp. Cla-17]
MTSKEFPASLAKGRSLERTTSSKTIFSNVMTGLVFACALLALIPLIALLFYVITKGAVRLGPQLFTQLPPPPFPRTSPQFYSGGFGNAILGTFMTVGIASLISIPFGILAAIYLSEFARDTKFASLINFMTNVLSGVPSIVMGVFAYGLIVLTTRSYSALAAGFALAILMLPTIVRTSTEAFEAVPNDIRQASVGLGASGYQTVLRVLLPAAIPAILTGIILSVARAAGETAPIIFTALFSNFWNLDAGRPTATLSVLVYNFAITPFANWQDLAWSAALVLVSLVLIANLLARWVTRKR